jgi:peptidoglycan/LPS O-acetylase OafA/YrhL
MVLRAVISHGFMAVNFFFVLSGFVLAYKYSGLSARGSERRRFWVARFWRIYPTYLLALILAAPIPLFAMRVGLLEFSIRRWVMGGLLSATCLQAWVPQAACSWNFTAWSISCEAFFYAIFPWLIVRLRTQSLRDALKTFAALWSLNMVGPCGLIIWDRLGLSTGWKGWETPVSIEQLFVLHFPLFHLPSFVMGAISGLIFLKRGALTAGTSALCIVGSSTAIVLGCVSPIPNEFIQDGLLAPAFALLIYALSTKSSWTAPLANGTMQTLGNASYAIYILQVPIFCGMAANLQLLGVDADRFPAACFLIFLAVLAAGAMLVSRVAVRTAQHRIASCGLSQGHATGITGF